MKQNSSAEADSNYDGKVRLITVPALWMLVVAGDLLGVEAWSLVPWWIKVWLQLSLRFYCFSWLNALCPWSISLILSQSEGDCCAGRAFRHQDQCRASEHQSKNPTHLSAFLQVSSQPCKEDKWSSWSQGVKLPSEGGSTKDWLRVSNVIFLWRRQN